MASATLQLNPILSPGSVSVYAATDWSPTVQPSGAPPGSAVTTGTVGSSGSVTLTGLTEGATYYAYQATPDRYIRFQTAAAASGGTVASPALSGSVIGQYYTTFLSPGQNWNASAGDGDALNKVYYQPAWLEAGTLDRLAQQPYGNNTAGEVMRLGLYADNGRGQPGALVVDGGTIDLSSAGQKAVTISTAVTKGLYWLAGARQGPSLLTTMIVVSFANHPSRPLLPYGDGTSQFNVSGYGAWRQAGVTGALPDPASGLTLGGDNVPPVFYRYSA